MADMTIAGKGTRGAWGQEARAMLALAWPIVLTNLAQIGFATTDVLLMGRLGADALAAGALATNLNFALVIFGLGLPAAVAPMIAHQRGRMPHSVREVRRTVQQGLWSAAILFVPMCLVLWQAEPIFLLLGQEPALAAAAAPYMHTLMWANLPFLAYQVLRSFVAALERPLPALWVGLAGVAVNAAVVSVLMFGLLGLPRLGLAGAGIGTTVANLAMFALMAAIVMRDRQFRRYRVFAGLWRADWPRLKALWRLGVPIALTLGFEVTIFNAAAFLMGIIGAPQLAAHAIAMQIASFTFMVPMGIAQAATVRVGRAFGAGDRDGVGRAGWTAYGLGLGFMTLTAAAMLLAPYPLTGAFLDLADPANAEVIGFAVTFLAVAGIFQLVDAAQVIGAGVLRGLHDTRVPMVFALIGYWLVGLPLGAALAFGAGIGGVGIWIGFAGGLAAVAALMAWRWLRRDRLAPAAG